MAKIAANQYTITDLTDGSIIWTTTVAPVAPNYTFTISNLVGPTGATPKVGDVILYSYYRYAVETVAATTVLSPTRVSIRGGTGASAIAYWMVNSAPALSRSIAGVYSPTTITISGKSQTGTSAPVDYSGRYIIAESTNGVDFTNKYTSSGDEASKVYTPSATNLKAIRIRFYLAGGTATLLDEQIVPITVDGATGATGNTGPAGRGISSTTVSYQAHSNGTSPPSTWLTTIPTVAANEYLWTRVVITYTSGDPTTSYAVGKMGAQGPQGPQGTTGATGAVGTGVDSIATEFYVSTSKTTQTGGSITTTMPTWSVGKYLWVRSKIVYKNPASTTYTAWECDSSWEAVNDIPDYIASRGENLLTNGTGLLGNNYNFPSFTFNSAEAYGAAGSFVISTSGTPLTTEFMPVDPNEIYRFSMYAKQEKGSSEKELNNHYSFVDMYDIDKNNIVATNIMWYAGTLTTLAQDLKPGDTKIYLASAENWKNAQGTNTHQRSIIFWKYQNAGGYEYPEQTYSRYYKGNAWDDGGINYSTNIITLSAPWNYNNPKDPQGYWRAGHPLSNGSSGGDRVYVPLNKVAVPEEWTYYSGTYEGIDTSGTNAGGKFRQGTAYVKIGWLAHYQAGQTTATEATNNKLYLSNITFNKDLSKIITISSQYYLSTSNSKLSGGSWSDTMQTWVTGRYIWERKKSIWDDSKVTYGPAQIATSVNLANEVAIDAQTGMIAANEAIQKKLSIYFADNVGDITGVDEGSLLYVPLENAVYRYILNANNVMEWVSAEDDLLAPALRAAKEAQDTADSKITTYTGSSKPGISLPLKQGDLWFNDYNQLHRWNGNDWVNIQDKGISDLESYMTTVVSSITGGSRIFKQSTQPTPPVGIDDLWFDTSQQNKCKKFNGVDWVEYDFTSVIKMINEATLKIHDDDTIVAVVRKNSAYKADLAEIEGQLNDYVKTNEFIEEVSTIIGDADSLKMSFESFAGTQDPLNRALVDLLEATGTYFNFGLDGLTISQLGSDFSIKIDNTELGFYQKTEKVAYINNNRLYINNAEFVHKLTIGNEDAGYTDIQTANSGLSGIWRAN